MAAIRASSGLRFHLRDVFLSVPGDGGEALLLPLLQEDDVCVGVEDVAVVGQVGVGQKRHQVCKVVGEVNPRQCWSQH